MNQQTLAFLLLFQIIFLFSCGENPNSTINSMPTAEQEKAAILAVLNNETKAAFQRDYAAWQDHWVHRPDVTKTYINFPDSSMTETVGWEKVNDFVKTYIEEHPEPDPLPDPLTDIDVRLYGEGAWVNYEQIDKTRGRKRETRLVEKVAGQWKIAGMHTTIYGMNE